jgi:hypothetical protein
MIFFFVLFVILNANLKTMDHENSCPVCYDSKPLNSLQCGHFVHSHCVWKSGTSICPICRKHIDFSKNQFRKMKKIANKYFIENKLLQLEEDSELAAEYNEVHNEEYNEVHNEEYNEVHNEEYNEVHNEEYNEVHNDLLCIECKYYYRIDDDILCWDCKDKESEMNIILAMSISQL